MRTFTENEVQNILLAFAASDQTIDFYQSHIDDISERKVDVMVSNWWNWVLSNS